MTLTTLSRQKVMDVLFAETQGPQEAFAILIALIIDLSEYCDNVDGTTTSLEQLALQAAQAIRSATVVEGTVQ